MMFLCLAFGDEAGWKSLSSREQLRFLSQDAVIRGRGATVSAVHAEAVSVRNWDGKLEVNTEPHQQGLPLAGFYLLEARDMDEVIELVANTPCARASGVIDIYCVSSQHDGDAG